LSTYIAQAVSETMRDLDESERRDSINYVIKQRNTEIDCGAVTDLWQNGTASEAWSLPLKSQTYNTRAEM